MNYQVYLIDRIETILLKTMESRICFLTIAFRIYYKTFIINVTFITNWANNDTADHTNKSYTIQSPITQQYVHAFSDDCYQSINEHMTRFKRCFTLKQYLHLKPIK